MSSFASLISQVSLRNLSLSFHCDSSFYSGKCQKLCQNLLRLLIQFLTLDLLKEAPLLRWAQSVKFFIRGQEKLGWLDGSKKAFAAGDLGLAD